MNKGNGIKKKEKKKWKGGVKEKMLKRQTKKKEEKSWRQKCHKKMKSFWKIQNTWAEDAEPK